MERNDMIKQTIVMEKFQSIQPTHPVSSETRMEIETENTSFRKWFEDTLKMELKQLGLEQSGNKRNVVWKNRCKYSLLWEILVGVSSAFPSTVLSESTFWLLGKTKTKLRNRMKESTIDSIIRIKSNNEERQQKAITMVLKRKNIFK